MFTTEEARREAEIVNESKKGVIRNEFPRDSFGKEDTSFSGCYKEAVAFRNSGSVFLLYSTPGRCKILQRKLAMNHWMRDLFLLENGVIFSSESKIKKSEHKLSQDTTKGNYQSSF